MQIEISFRHLAHSDAIEAIVRQKADKIGKLHPRITACRVVIEATNRKSSTKATVYRVRIDAAVPGGEIVAERAPSLKPQHEDLGAAVREAFDILCREIHAHLDRQRDDVKTHEEPPESIKRST